jgi:hypothetical protein
MKERSQLTCTAGQWAAVVTAVYSVQSQYTQYKVSIPSTKSVYPGTSIKVGIKSCS